MIDPNGYIVGKAEGEGNYETIDEAIAEVVAEARERKQLNEEPLKLVLERARMGDLPLAFPGKVLADERTGRLFIADSNHHRIVIARTDGTILDTIGTGEAGMRDGAYASATFQRPQGMALDGETLYVADTGNHLLRRINLQTRAVETVAGTGRQGRWQEQNRTPRPAREVGLSSPWDLLLSGRTLYVAMAGPHQIWKYETAGGVISPFAGSGREARTDGALQEAAFAQPSGLATDGRKLYVADSESNIIRAIDLNEGGEVRTLAGGDLFEFGDRDGRGDEVRLQHPLGVAAHGGAILIADTYNHKIKRLHPQTGRVETFAGTGRPGQADGARPAFYEPGGLSVAAGKLYVADTNNHAIRVLDLKSGQATTLNLRGLRPPDEPATATTAAGADDASPNIEEVKLAPQRLRLGGRAALNVSVVLPAGYHLNPSAPQRYRVSVEKGDAHLSLAGTDSAPAKVAARSAKDLALPLRLPLRALSAGDAELLVRLTIFYCREDNTGTCQIKTLVWRAPVRISDDAGAPEEITVEKSVSVSQ